MGLAPATNRGPTKYRRTAPPAAYIKLVVILGSPILAFSFFFWLLKVDSLPVFDSRKMMEGKVGYRAYLSGGHPTNTATMMNQQLRGPVNYNGTVYPPVRGGPYSVDPSTIGHYDPRDRPGANDQYDSLPPIIPPREISEDNNLFTSQYALGRYTDVVDTQYASGGRMLYILRDPVTGNDRHQYASAQGGQRRIFK